MIFEGKNGNTLYQRVLVFSDVYLLSRFYQILASSAYVLT